MKEKKDYKYRAAKDTSKDYQRDRREILKFVQKLRKIKKGCK